ncbi:hypothetical protein Ae201684_005859 [Aphanomyces euteiches]|uniref:Reverse transcriptase Ty1/copia-type domain-containing protein n=1 Tax=Aphanomyces euteiches TaxID=100861 RepID=A0A6G0XE11_9STRA|nr:hypothetical protein Ae201684_005859 [Aphanomyces euteiches]
MKRGQILKKHQNGSWIPRGCFERKRIKIGNVVKYKVRLVIRGFLQVPGVDFGDTYSPVARIVAVRAVLAIAASKDYHIKQTYIFTDHKAAKLVQDFSN